MDDLISRQAAIDAIKGLLDSMLETDTIGFYEIENVLFEVPSAEPEVTAEMIDSYVKPRHLRVISEEVYMHLTSGKYLPPPIFQPTQPERKKGHYIGEADGYADGELVYDIWSCSECGCYFEDWDEEPTYNFCPNCGADMRGEE